MSLSKLKQNKTKMRDALKAQMDAENREAPQYEKNYNEDERFWQPTVNKDGNAFCTIRFLPPPMNGDELPDPYVQYREFAFKYDQTGKWYINRDRTSIPVKSRGPDGKPNDGIERDDPAQQHYSSFWGKGKEAENQARAMNRNHYHVANILVISDPNAPENNGKVFLFRYKKTIQKMLDKAMKPDSEDPDAVELNPFDMWDGADFKLKITRKDNYRNYDTSIFASPSPVADTDEEIEEIYNKTHDLQDIVDLRHWRPYDALKKQLDKVLGRGSTAEELEDLGRTAEATPMREVASAKMRSEESSYDEEAEEPVEVEEVEEPSDPDDTISYFKKLAAGG